MVTNKVPTKLLSLHRMTWEQLSSTMFKVCFNGHFDEHFANIEKELFGAGMTAISRKYDKLAKKTYTIYKVVA